MDYINNIIKNKSAYIMKEYNELFKNKSEEINIKK